MSINPIAPNQTVVETSSGTVFFSYKTPVAACVDGKHYRTEKYHSRTTSKHINQWLDGQKAEVKPQEWFNALT